jgi:HCOMODA/2-hydroxy-3-carboxy-muconic semialdehyde decarboxylase
MKSEERELLVRRAARALGRHGLVNAFGHCSARVDEQTFLVCAPQPMGTIAPGKAGTVVNVDGPLPEGVLGEVRIHQQIYRRRPEVNGITRTAPPNVSALSAMRAVPLPRTGFGAYFGADTPFWDDPQLLRNDEQASKLADLMGDARALIMRGNGAITAGESLEAAVVFAYFLDEAARVELTVRMAGELGTAPVLSPDECAKRAVTAGGIYERMWSFLTYGDPE